LSYYKPAKTLNPFIRAIPLGVLFIFWAVYVVVEILYRRFDVLASAIPIGLFIIAYVAARIKAVKGSQI
jgi:hypothetical protein